MTQSASTNTLFPITNHQRMKFNPLFIWHFFIGGNQYLAGNLESIWLKDIPSPPKHTEHYIYNNEAWLILSNQGGTDKRIMDRIFHQLEAMLSHYSKVLVIRFDLHLSQETQDNTIISAFQKQLIKAIIKEHKYKSELGYIWAREQKDSHAQHYHYALMLNGHKIRHSHKILQTVQKIWQPLSLSTCYFVENPYYMVKRKTHDKGLSMQEAIPRLSYLAKRDTKDTHSGTIKRYQTSRVKPKMS